METGKLEGAGSMITHLLTRFCARHLSRQSHKTDRNKVKAVARQIRREMGLPKSEALR